MLSGELVTALEDANEERGVGVVFPEFSSRLKEVYGVYCRNHDHASQLLEKVSYIILLHNNYVYL